MKKIQPTYVYAVADCGTATADGIGINLREGDVWAGDDPLVLGRPGQAAGTRWRRKPRCPFPCRQETNSWLEPYLACGVRELTERAVSSPGR